MKEILKSIVDEYYNKDKDSDRKYDVDECIEAIKNNPANKYMETINVYEFRYGFTFTDIYEVEYEGEKYYFGLEDLSAGYKHDFESLFGDVDAYIDRMPKLYNRTEEVVTVSKYERC